MNAPSPINTLDDAHRRATDEANQWRGRLVNLYATAEGRVSDALQALAPEKAPPLLLSQRILRLKKFTKDDELILELLKLEERLVERNSLVHGQGKVWIDLKGNWLLHLRNRGRAGEQQYVVTRDSVKSCHDELHKLVQRLTSKLKT